MFLPPGTNGQYGFGSGSAIDRSLSYSVGTGASFGLFGAVGDAGLSEQYEKSYMVYLPSGTSIETYYYYTGGGASGISISPTSTFFQIKACG